MATNKTLTVVFFKTDAGNEPVRDELKALSTGDRKIVGEDVKTVEYGWPIGLPVCRPLEKGVWEVRSNISSKRIFRVLFGIDRGLMILLHAFVKKNQDTPKPDKDLAIDRWAQYKRNKPKGKKK